MQTLIVAIESATAVAIISAVAAIGFVVAALPWFVGFGVAVAAAATWCAWLERHPD